MKKVFKFSTWTRYSHSQIYICFICKSLIYTFFSVKSPHTCTMCQKTFTQKSHLTRHMKIHGIFPPTQAQSSKQAGTGNDRYGHWHIFICVLYPGHIFFCLEDQWFNEDTVISFLHFQFKKSMYGTAESGKSQIRDNGSLWLLVV